jgi:hypothetical protein
MAAIAKLLLWTFLLTAITATGFALHRIKILGKSVILFLFAVVALSILSQQPWRPNGAIHIVASATVAGLPVHIVQVHEQLVHPTYVVAKDRDGTWKWFGIGNDELYWYRAKQISSNGIVKFSRWGQGIAAYDPADGRVTWFGHKQDWSRQTTQFP